VDVPILHLTYLCGYFFRLPFEVYFLVKEGAHCSEELVDELLEEHLTVDRVHPLMWSSKSRFQRRE